MQSQIDKILQKRMDRKDFLKHIAFSAVAMVGVTSLIKALNPADVMPSQKTASTYGGSAYGGKTHA